MIGQKKRMSLKRRRRLDGSARTALRRNVCALMMALSLVGQVPLGVAEEAFGARFKELPAADPRLVLWYAHPADKWENVVEFKTAPGVVYTLTAGG